MSLLNIGTSTLRASQFAHAYWAREQGPALAGLLQPCWEVLLSGRIFVVEKYRKKTANFAGAIPDESKGFHHGRGESERHSRRARGTGDAEAGSVADRSHQDAELFVKDLAMSGARFLLIGGKAMQAVGIARDGRY